MWNARYGGAETMLIDILNCQVQNNELRLVVINDLIDEALFSCLDKRVEIVLIKRKPGSRSLSPIIRLNRLILWGDWDIVHFHQDDIIRYVPVRIFKRNLCITVHNVEMDVQDVKKYNHVFAISSEVSLKVEAKCGFKPMLVVNGIAVHKFVRKEGEGQRVAPYRIIQISRFHEQKGHTVMIRALRMLIDVYQFDDIHLFLLGEGESEGCIRALVEELGLSKQVTFMGIRPKEYVQQHLHEYDLLVQPSLWEGFGLTAIEAMAAKVPCLLSDIEGMRTAANDGKAAFLFKSESSEALAAQVYNIAHLSPPELEEKTQQAWEYVASQFDVSRTARDYLNHYQSISEKIYPTNR